MKQSPSYVITLVHGTKILGTFARNPQWINKDSHLCQTLKKTLSDDVRFPPFKWSGWNDQGFRHRAAEELKDQLSTQLKEFPYAKHYVIAHSHGGNIALYALREDKLLDNLAGVVCLSTPFLHTKWRNLGGVEARIVVRDILRAIFLMLLLVVGFIVPPYDNYDFSLIFFVCLLVLPSLLANRLHPRLKKMATECLESMRLPQDNNHKMSKKVLMMRTSGDEATQWLGVSSIVSRLTRIAIRCVVKVKKIVERLPLAWLADLVLVSPVAILGVLSTSVACVAFGPRLGLCSTLLEIDADHTPLGEWPSGTTDPRLKDGSLFQLSHSALYDDDIALNRISEWIKAPQNT